VYLKVLHHPKAAVLIMKKWNSSPLRGRGSVRGLTAGRRDKMPAVMSFDTGMSLFAPSPRLSPTKGEGEKCHKENRWLPIDKLESAAVSHVT
jgi:hypothetical protein